MLPDKNFRTFSRDDNKYVRICVILPQKNEEYAVARLRSMQKDRKC
jgi:hypothetical protein